VILPDLNVLLYAVDADSARHDSAATWLEETVNKGAEEIGLPQALS
jgi:predicted nucleic acid-binding protein